ncbi:hypothetical protein GGR26_003163 [Lewinella marina]|uniref:hypothetical protein n=1 Tax=Neolewinella marina TaxID=438751 RepID=UPI00117BDB2F|nr:hypothetical protein [Neolewinella marina]NJB87383.1 hypothetical protein [Neolewinella marina]
MRAIYKKPTDNSVGYITWATPCLVSDIDLQESLDKIVQYNYLIDSDLEEGRVYIRCKKNIEVEFLPIRTIFPYFKIAESTIQKEYSFDNYIFKGHQIFMPVEKLEIFSPIYSAECNIFPPRYLQFSKLRHINFNELFRIENGSSIRDKINELTYFDEECLNSFPLVMIDVEIDFPDYLRLKNKEIDEKINEYTSKSNTLFDVIRFQHCNFTIPQGLPGRPGTYGYQYSAAVSYFSQHGIWMFDSREVLVKKITAGIGIQIHSSEDISYHKVLQIEGETGNISKHALRLMSDIMESDNDSLKFVQIFTLIEFLGNPKQYQKLSESKKLVTATVASSKSEYYSLNLRLEELTAGLKNGNGERIPVGLRTEIIHNGKSIISLIPSFTNRKKLFAELYDYVAKAVHFMISHSDKDWSTFNDIRIIKRDNYK